LFTFGQNLSAESRYAFKRREGKDSLQMEEQYKGHVIRVTTEKDNSAFPWKPICRILHGTSREFIKQIDWQIGYETPEQAEKAGLLISKKWIEAGKPNL
jgi:hypothetical protein